MSLKFRVVISAGLLIGGVTAVQLIPVQTQGMAISNQTLAITAPATNQRVSSPLAVQGRANKNEKVDVHVVAHFTGG